MQFAPKEYHFGEDLGRQLGTGLTNTLSSLAQFKLQDIIKRQQASTQRGLLSEATKGMYSPEEVNLMNVFPYGSKEQLNVMQMLAQAHPQGIGQQPLENQMMQQLGQQPSAPRTVGQIMGMQQPFAQQQPMNAREALAGGIQTPQMRQSERQFGEKMKVQYHQATEKVRNEIRKASQSADQDIAQLGKLRRLSEANKLPNDKVYKILDTMGMSDVGSLVGADAQEFNKIITDMTGKLKDRYGAKVTNFELGTFLRGIPSLLQTPEGRSRVINDLQLLAKIPQERYNMMRQIIKENGNVPPLDIAEQVEDRLKDYKKQIFDKYQEYGEDIPQYNVLSKRSSQPKAVTNKGKVFKFPDGKMYQSDGMRWRPVEVKGNQVSFLPEEELM